MFELISISSFSPLVSDQKKSTLLVLKWVAILLFWSLSMPINADGITTIARHNQLIKKGEEAMKKKDWKTAIQSYESLIGNSTDIPGQVHLNLGHAYYQMKESEKAQKNYLSAIGLLESPGLKSVGYQQMGNLNFKKQDYKGAMEWYKKSLRTNPGNQSARFNYELAYQMNQKQEEEKKKENQENENNKSPSKDQKEKQDQQKQDQKQDPKGKEGQKEKDPKQEQKDPRKQGKDGKDQNKKGNESEDGDEKETKEGKNQNDKNNREEVNPEGDEQSKNQNKEAKADEANVSRVDKKKLQEIGLSEDQAKILLQAMRQSEIKYLQQKRFGNKKGTSNGKKRW